MNIDITKKYVDSSTSVYKGTVTDNFIGYDSSLFQHYELFNIDEKFSIEVKDGDVLIIKRRGKEIAVKIKSIFGIQKEDVVDTRMEVKEARIKIYSPNLVIVLSYPKLNEGNLPYKNIYDEHLKIIDCLL